MKYCLVVLLMFFTNFLIAANADNHKNRFYVNPTNIFFEENKIFVLNNDQLYEVSSIKSDEKGLFVKVKWSLPFYCTNCHRWSSAFTIICEHC